MVATVRTFSVVLSCCWKNLVGSWGSRYTWQCVCVCVCVCACVCVCHTHRGSLVVGRRSEEQDGVLRGVQQLLPRERHEEQQGGEAKKTSAWTRQGVRGS